MNSEKDNNSLFIYARQLSENIIKVAYTYNMEEPRSSSLIEKELEIEKELVKDQFLISEDSIFFNNNGQVILKEIEHRLIEKDIFRYVVDGEPVVKHKQTANGGVAYIENARQEFVENGYEGKLTFSITEDEQLYGLGQHEDGIYNYKDKIEYLFQSNMKISIPFLLSSRNYGILIDTESAIMFDSTQGRITFTIDTTNELVYYVIIGKDFDEIIKALRELTGRVPMLPRWAYGYIQSKERYHSSEELINVVDGFRKHDIPIDCIVQDWLTWEDGLWGEKRVDKKRYPDLMQLIKSLHGKHAKLMVSIWPNMAVGGQNLKEFKDKGLLLPNSTIYDAFNETARDIYWRQCEEDWFSAGVDAWWCDNSEPFSDPDWNGETKRPDEQRYQLITEESKKSMDWMRLNTFGLFHSKGIYENWHTRNKAKRVVILTRSSYISGQKYGAVLWSGDISANWSTFKKQITEGIKFSMSGMPYWTLDIGGFFTVKDKWENRGCGCSKNTNKLWFWNGDYNSGVNDLGYRELYVRWLQYATFLPMFRAHGTDTPREPWNFGNPGEIFYDTILKFIKLRYKLLPYIYSLAAAVHQHHSTMIRSLMFDFAEDENVKELSDSFMLGKAFLVCPVTEPMYYEENSVPIQTASKTKEIYLPRGTKWYDFWTNEIYSGGQTIRSKPTLEILPLYVRAGSIIPVSDSLKYADEKNGEVSELIIYTGENGEFTLYNDEGDNYSYESGNYSNIQLSYNELEKSLTFGKVSGYYKYQDKFKIRVIGNNQTLKIVDITYNGEEERIYLSE